MRQVTHIYQRLVTNIYANTSFSCLFSSIIGTMISTPQHSDEKRGRLIKESRCFSCKKRGHTTYDCLRKGKIAAILEIMSEDSNSQGKE